jgi:dTDP-D-glucose 4,6-dehydratase
MNFYTKIIGGFVLLIVIALTVIFLFRTTDEKAIEQLSAGQWEMRCPQCRAELRPLPTDEDKRLNPTSIYAITKKVQEEMLVCFGRAYELPVVALRVQSTSCAARRTKEYLWR